MRILLALVLAVSVTPSAYAYIDPAAGSIIFQIIVGGIAGLTVAFKLFWHRLTGRGKAADISSDE